MSRPLLTVTAIIALLAYGYVSARLDEAHDSRERRFSVPMPPAKHRAKMTVASVAFIPAAAVQGVCTRLLDRKPPEGARHIVACTVRGDVISPDPCAYPHEAYARVMCHELGHVNGWPAAHPK